MAIVTKVEPIDDFVEAVVREDLSREGRQKALAAFARTRLGEAQEANRAVLGAKPRHVTFVDGRRGAALENVDPDRGRIVFEFDLVRDMLVAIAKLLDERSPVRSGAYRRGHRLFAAGVEVLPTDPNIPEAEDYTFVNLVPYARKIEIGKTKSGRDFVVQVPNRIYERTARDAGRRYGNLAKIRFSYRAPIGGAIVPYRSGSAASRRGGIERASRAPAIIVSLR